MAEDVLLYAMLSPIGLFIIGLFIFLPFIIWKKTLGEKYESVGKLPLATGYLFSFMGLVIYAFISAYIEFSGRVEANILEESQRYSIVPGWTFFMFFMFLTFALPCILVVLVPTAAKLINKNRFTYKNIILSMLIAIFAITFISWLFPSNLWHSTHRFESFMMILKSTALTFFAFSMPFFLGIYWRVNRNNQTGNT